MLLLLLPLLPPQHVLPRSGIKPEQRHRIFFSFEERKPSQAASTASSSANSGSSSSSDGSIWDDFKETADDADPAAAAGSSQAAAAGSSQAAAAGRSKAAATESSRHAAAGTSKAAAAAGSSEQAAPSPLRMRVCEVLVDTEAMERLWGQLQPGSTIALKTQVRGSRNTRLCTCVAAADVQLWCDQLQSHSCKGCPSSGPNV
jgi:hypothetical protein